MKDKDKKKYMKDIDFKYNFKEYYSFLSKYKLQFLILIAIVFLLSVTYVADKYIFKEVIDRGTDFTNGILSQQAFVSILLILVVIFFSLLFVRALFKWMQHAILIKVTSKMMADLRKKYFNHILLRFYFY